MLLRFKASDKLALPGDFTLPNQDFPVFVQEEIIKTLRYLRKVSHMDADVTLLDTQQRRDEALFKQNVETLLREGTEVFRVCTI